MVRSAWRALNRKLAWPLDAWRSSGVGPAKRIDERTALQLASEPRAEVGYVGVVDGSLARSDNRDEAVSALPASTNSRAQRSLGLERGAEPGRLQVVEKHASRIVLRLLDGKHADLDGRQPKR